MEKKRKSILSFNLYLSPDGTVTESTNREARIICAVMGEEHPIHQKGGIIILSTDVNASVGKGFVNKAKGFLKTWYNRIKKSDIVDDEIKKLIDEKGIDTGWSIGNLFKGRYYSSKSGKLFNEKSFTVEIKGVPYDFVKEVAIKLGQVFDQESVLVTDNETGNTNFVDVK